MGKRPPKSRAQKWVIAYAKGPYLVDYLRHPDFMFDDAQLAAERRPDAFLLLQPIVPGLILSGLYIVPLREFET